MMERPLAPESGLMSGRQHALDGLRTIAVAGVFLFHTTTRLRLGVFYAKRLARLWPALLVLCAVVVMVGLTFPSSGWGGQEADAIPAAAYVMNLSNYGVFGSSTGGGALSPTWTLAVAWITDLLAAGCLVSRFFLVSGGASLARIYNGPCRDRRNAHRVRTVRAHGAGGSRSSCRGGALAGTHRRPLHRALRR